MAIRLEAAGRTHVGLVRQRNEDSFYVGESLVAVADGLGGHVAGDVASQTAIACLKSYDRSVDSADLSTTLGTAVSAANRALSRKIHDDPKVLGMGTTLVAMLWSGTSAIVANIGDSRAYLLRTGGDATSQITEDHTFAHLVSEAGRIPRLSERLSRFLDGRADGRSPDLTRWSLLPGDRFLLCSDGLSSFVPHQQIHGALAAATGPGDTADRLIELAMDQGGRDNITVIVVDVATG